MIENLKKIIENYFSYFSYFYRYLKSKMLIILIISILVGILDGFGLAMFLPLLEMVSDKAGEASGVQLGNLSFIVNFIKLFGFELTITTVLFSMMFFFVTKGCFSYLESHLNVIYRRIFVCKLRESNIKALSTYSYELFVHSDVGRIQNTLSAEVGRVMIAYSVYMNVMKNSVMLIVYSLLALISNPGFAILVAAGGYITNLLFGTLYKKTKLLSKELVQNNHLFQGLLIQQVAFFKYLKSTGLIYNYSDKLIEKVYKIEFIQKKIGIINAIMQGIREPMLVGVVVMVILIQVNLLGSSLGLILLSILYFYRALTNVIQLQTFWNQFLSLSGSIENIKEFLYELQKGRENDGKIDLIRFQKNIIIKEVKFSYAKRTIIKDLNLVINKNETVAFVGESGAGKTTILNLICGLILPQKGVIMVDGIPIHDINRISYSNRIGYITQEPVIFDDTIYNNVTFWSPKTDNNLIRFYEALSKASMHDFVMSLENKGEERLGNNGINLSGGQKQRISIAREIFKDIDILIMDEATSSLDTETEISIRNNIESLKGKYTILIVAHRLSTIKNADKIIVMKNGRITQTGRYEELISKGSDFSKMVALQEL